MNNLPYKQPLLKTNLLERVNIAYRNRVEEEMKRAYPDIDMSQIEITHQAVLALIEILEKEL